jgi:hypothetical protein
MDTSTLAPGLSVSINWHRLDLTNPAAALLSPVTSLISGEAKAHLVQKLGASSEKLTTKDPEGITLTYHSQH